MKNKLTRDRVITVENYTERYIPIIIVKQLKHIVAPLLDEDQAVALDNTTARYYMDLAEIIANDQGEGSIAKNILETNVKMEELLKVKVDLTRVDQVAARTALGRSLCPRCDFLFK